MKYLFSTMFTVLAACSSTSIDTEKVSKFTNQFEVFQTETKLISKNRHAVVKIYSVSSGATMGVGTGTLFSYEGKTIVLTAAHVVTSEKNVYAVVIMGYPVESKIVYLDEEEDIAILQLTMTPSVRPMSFISVSKKQLKIGDEILYSGYPNNDNLFSIKGYVAGLFSNGNLCIHAYAWPGASGSAILDRRGHLIGVLSAISIGGGIDDEPTVIEDIVIVVPIWKLDLAELKKNLT